MNTKNKYVSFFKIDGVPILPPLITEKKRQELLRYKELAIALEIKLKLESENKRLKVVEETIAERDYEHFDDEYLKVSNLLQAKSKKTELTSKKNLVPGTKHISNLKKSDTFIYDIITNTVIIPYDDNEITNQSSKERKLESCSSSIRKENDVDKIVPTKKQPNTERLPYTARQEEMHICGVTYPTKQAIPSIHIKPPTPELVKKVSKETERNIYNKCETSSNKKQHTKSSTEDIKISGNPTDEQKTPRRSTTSPSLKNTNIPSTPLIRSNSFTLESPSNALLQHMVKELSKEKLKSPEATKKAERKVLEFNSKDSSKIQNTITQSKQKKIVFFSQQKSERKSNPEPRVSTLLITNNSMFKNKKSPYEIKLSSRNKMLKKHKSPIVKTISAVSIKHRNRPFSKSNEVEQSSDQNLKCIPNESDLQDVLKLEENQRAKLLELLKIQQEEHRKMQETFEKQKKMLLMEITGHSLGGGEAECPGVGEIIYQKTNSDEKCQEPNLSTRNVKNSLLSSKFSLELGNSTCHPKISPRRRLFTADDITRCKEKPTTPVKRREEAATIINAYVRGYLVRRLFRTDYVKRVVQTIRDTLLFVLELHIETRFDDSEENIKLKARLLQQLTSSSYTLHRIFFELNPKEKMDIIAKDRMFIKNSHISQIRSPRLQ